MSRLDAWVAAGAHRRRTAQGDTEYSDPAGVAIMDELNPHLIQAVFDPLLNDPANGGTVGATNGLASGYSKLPMGFTDVPSGRGGSSYDGGYEGYMVKVLQQLHGTSVAQPFSADMMSKICGTGSANCATTIGQAVTDTYNAMKTANGNSANVATWTKDDNLVFCASNSCPTQMPAYDNITFQGVGVVGQPDMDWQNRPTFQQVADFPSHRPRAGAGPLPVTSLPNTAASGSLAAGLLFGLIAAAVAWGWRRRPEARPVT